MLHSSVQEYLRTSGFDLDYKKKQTIKSESTSVLHRSWENTLVTNPESAASRSQTCHNLLVTGFILV